MGSCFEGASLSVYSLSRLYGSVLGMAGLMEMLQVVQTGHMAAKVCALTNRLSSSVRHW